MFDLMQLTTTGVGSFASEVYGFLSSAEMLCLRWCSAKQKNKLDLLAERDDSLMFKLFFTIWFKHYLVHNII